MRLLLVHNRYRAIEPSGENYVVESEAHELSRRGHEVQVWGPSSDEIAGYGTREKVALPGRVVWSRKSRSALGDALDRHRPDVVHLHNTFPLISGSILGLLADRKVPTVATLHNYRLLCASGVLFREGRICHDCVGSSTLHGVRHGCYRDSRLATVPITASNLLHLDRWKRLNALLTLSSAQRDVFVQAGFEPDRIIVKPNFVTEFPGSAVVTPPGEGFVYAGRLAETKGLRVVMDAWVQLEARGLRPPLTIIGTGPLESEVERFCASHPWVRAVGRLSRDECFEAFRACRAVLVPSIWEETFGLVVAEAMMFGRAAVATKLGSFPDLIRHRDDGLLVAPNDPSELAAAVEELCLDDRLPATLGLAARQTYQRRFRPDPNLALLESIYEQVSGRPRP